MFRGSPRLPLPNTNIVSLVSRFRIPPAWRVAVGIALAPAAAAAEEALQAVARPQADGDTWTAARAAEHAADHAPNVEFARALLDRVRPVRVYGDVPLVQNPQIGVRGVYEPVERSAHNARVVQVTLGVPLDFTARRRRYTEEADFGIREAEALVGAAQNDARARARAAYADAAVADELLIVEQARVDTARSILAVAKKRLDAQAGTIIDVTLAERELGEARANYASAEKARAEARAAFRDALNLDPLVVPAVSPVTPPDLPSGVSIEAAVDRAVEKRRELEALRAAVAKFDRQAERLFQAAVGPVWISAEYEHDRGENLVGAGVNWTVPIFQVNQGDRAVARGEQTAAERLGNVTKRTIAREVSGLWTVLETRVRELTTLRNEALPAAAAVLDQTNELFEAGAVDIFRVLLVRQSLFSLRIRALEALRDAWRTRIALDRAIMLSPDADRGTP